MINRLILLIIFIGFINNSCDCVLQAEGVVLDADIKIPIAGVIISRDPDLKKDLVESDSSGYFLFSDITGGWKCSDLKLYFQKTGYAPFEKDYQNTGIRNDTIYLKKQ